MTEIFLKMGIDTPEKWLKLVRQKYIREYRVYPVESPQVEDGFHYQDDGEGESTLYIWTRKKRVSLNFKNDELVNILVPTNSMVYC